MAFVQIIKIRSGDLAGLDAAHEEWLAASEGQRTVSRELLCSNRDDPDEQWILVEFPSYEAAMQNNDLPATSEIAGKIAALADGEPQFVNLDVRRMG